MNNLSSEALENLKKSILYKGIYRGTRENDFLIKEFIEFIFKNHGSSEILNQLHDFVLKDDQEILNLIKDPLSKLHCKIEEMFVEFYNQKLK